MCSISGWSQTKPDPEALPHRTNTQAINITVQPLHCVVLVPDCRDTWLAQSNNKKKLSRAQFPLLDTFVAKVVTGSITAGGTAAGPFENESERFFYLQHQIWCERSLRARYYSSNILDLPKWLFKAKAKKSPSIYFVSPLNPAVVLEPIPAIHLILSQGHLI